MIKLTPKAFREVSGVAITTNHNDKMAGMWSTSTACSDNEICKKRAAVPGSVCAKCYAMKQLTRFKNQRNMLVNNSVVLMDTELDPDIMPDFSGAPLDCFRFEAFGDIATITQVRNYFLMAAANPGTACALWTKNPWIVEMAIKGGAEKPDNLKIIGSSWKLNDPMIDYFKKFDFIDNIFTVYEPDYAKAHGVKITCGGKSCKDCKCKCYKGTHSSYEINELLK